MRNEEIKLADKYRYLGCVLTEHLSYKAVGDSFAEGASRAVGKLIGKHFQNKCLGYKTYSKLYDSCVCPIMEYCSAVWGYEKNENLDVIHHRAICAFLGVSRFGAIAGIEGEMGWITQTIRA